MIIALRIWELVASSVEASPKKKVIKFVTISIIQQFVANSTDHFQKRVSTVGKTGEV